MLPSSGSGQSGFFYMPAALCLFCLLGIAFAHAQANRWTAPLWADTLAKDKFLSFSGLTEGKALYKAECIVCHGETGRGEGESGFGLDIPPGDFMDEFTLNESNGSIFWKITNGRRPMPGYQSKLSELQRWQLVVYIRELQRQYLMGQIKKKF